MLHGSQDTILTIGTSTWLILCCGHIRSMRGQTGSDGEMRNPGSARTCAHSRLLSLPFFGRRLISLFVDSNHVLIQTPCVPHHPTSLASSPTIANIRHYLTPIRIVPALYLYRISLSRTTPHYPAPPHTTLHLPTPRHTTPPHSKSLHATNIPTCYPSDALHQSGPSCIISHYSTPS